jgi:hypothetical protein
MKSAGEIGQAVLARLAAQAAANRTLGDLLRAEVRAVVRAHREKLTAKQVIKELTRERLPSVRRVQEILRALRAESTPRG